MYHGSLRSWLFPLLRLLLFFHQHMLKNFTDPLCLFKAWAADLPAHIRGDRPSTQGKNCNTLSVNLKKLYVFLAASASDDALLELDADLENGRWPVCSLPTQSLMWCLIQCSMYTYWQLSPTYFGSRRQGHKVGSSEVCWRESRQKEIAPIWILPGICHCLRQFPSLPNKQQECLLLKAHLKAVGAYNGCEGLLGFLASML